MEFGSKYVYNYSDSEEEFVSDDEFEEGYDAASAPPVVAPAAPVLAIESNVGATSTVAAESGPPPSPRALSDTAMDATSSRSSSMSTPLSPSPRTSGDAITDAVSSSHLVGVAALAAAPRIAAKKSHHWLTEPTATKSSKQSKRSTELDRAVPREPPPSRGGAMLVAAKKWRRADTNVIAVKFDHLTAPSNMHTGDAVVCTNCEAMLSHISQLKDEGEEKVWMCDFCDTRNVVDIMSEEIPAQLDVTYMVEPAPATTAGGRVGADESLVVFCIDTSGSMCVSQEVPGQLNLRGSHINRYRSLNTEGGDQWMPRQNRNVTYITRLQGVQAAVDHQLEELAIDHPGRRAALVTFNSEITVIGDGRITPVTVAGDKLLNEDELINIGASLGLPACVKDVREILGQKVFDLEEGGQTALGPAMLVSVALACQVPGSKVIMCTDGMANVGVGSLEKDKKNTSGNTVSEASARATAFYTKVGEIAKNKGVSVSIFTIAGTDCKLVELGSVANATGGQVNIVDPMKLTQEFGNILADPIIASHVVATFHVHRGLYIRGEAEKTSCVKRDVGNVTKDSEVTFEYGIRSTRHAPSDAAHPTPDAAHPTPDVAHSRSEAMDTDSSQEKSKEPGDLPFQVQICYTDLDGARAMRVLTQTKPVTTERQQAETYINMPVVGAHAAQQSSRYALEGEYTPSRLNGFMYQRLMARQAHQTSEHMAGYGMYNAMMQPLDRHLLTAQTVEARASGSSVSRYEEAPAQERPEERSRGSRFLSMFGGSRSHPASASNQSNSSSRREDMTDETANVLYTSSKVSSKAFKK